MLHELLQSTDYKDVLLDRPKKITKRTNSNLAFTTKRNFKKFCYQSWFGSASTGPKRCNIAASNSKVYFGDRFQELTSPDDERFTLKKYPHLETLFKHKGYFMTGLFILPSMPITN